MNPTKENVILPLVLAFPNIVIGVSNFYFGKGQTPQPGSVVVTPNDPPAATSTTVETKTDPITPPNI